MSQSVAGRGGRIVGDYSVGRQIGSGSFSVVWHARNRVHGTEVAIKEIAMGRLNKKLQESLRSEIFILRRVNHPNIIRLHDIIEDPGKIHIVLEYCRGGDLSMYINRHGQIPETTAKHFMQQLAAGLKILRENNLIHRDLKPQNLLLSTNDDNAVLKIADFGFARSLQPSGMAETLCGSPLYMAPEIMQLQKYDAKADLWSVGAILFQLVTGKTPFTGNNQIQLLQNILKSTELRFPPVDKDLSFECKDLCQKLLRRNPVERLTFEEFFNHPFISPTQPDISLRSESSSRSMDGIPSAGSSPLRNTEESSQDESMPFFLDDDSSGPEGSPLFFKKRSPIRSDVLNNADFTSRHGSARNKSEIARRTADPFSDENLNEPPRLVDKRPASSRVSDSLESIDQEDYVLVSNSGPPLDSSSILATVSEPGHTIATPVANALPSVPMPIIGAIRNDMYHIRNLESRSSAPEASHGLMNVGDASEHPSTHCLTRIKSLQQFASAITELVQEKVDSGRKLEAFSIELVILAIWKQALHICHTYAASATEGSPSQGSFRSSRKASKMNNATDTASILDVLNSQGPDKVSSYIESEFLKEVERAEELAKEIKSGNAEMPDAMETIFLAALSLGRNGGVDELMGNSENAATLYAKAVQLLRFLQIEAPSLILNPPFTLTNSDRYRLRSYIDLLNNRHAHLKSQRLALPKSENQQRQFPR